MTKTHKAIIGVVALILISLTAVFALNNNGRDPSTTKVPRNAGQGGFTCSCCNHHGLMEAYMKAAEEEASKEDTCPCGCDACKKGEPCTCENCTCSQCGQKAD